MAGPRTSSKPSARADRLLESARASVARLNQRQAAFAAARAALDPAERFVTRVLQALPWVDGDDLRAAAQSSTTTTSCGLGLGVDHAALRRRDSARQGLCWRRFSEVVANGVADSFRRGELTYEDALRAISKCAHACDPLHLIVPTIQFAPPLEQPATRRRIAGLTWEGSIAQTIAMIHVQTVEQLAHSTVRPRRRRRPTLWIQRVAVAVILVLAENRNQPIALDVYNEWRSPILSAASDWLITLGVVDCTAPVGLATLYKWYRAHSPQRRRPGRPRRQIVGTSARTNS